MIVLGIETSCDETAAGVVQDGKRLLSNVVATSLDLHVQYGGVVPEIAARSHIESIMPVIQQALDDAFGSSVTSHQSLATGDQRQVTQFDPWSQIDAIAVTCGAGLNGSLLIGVLAARTLAIVENKPLYGVNHVEGHIYANFLTELGPNPKIADYQLLPESPQFPMLGIIVSGNHSQFVVWRNHFDYTLLGQTHDDAIGEAFDKVAKMLGLPYPGGVSIEKLAPSGNAQAFPLPKAKLSGKYDFSFSGLKTAVLRSAQEAVGKDYSLPSIELPHLLSDTQKADIAASFRRIACETIVDKVVAAYQEFSPKSVVIGGGVAASQELRRQLSERLPLPLHYMDMRLCGDNGGMVAALGCYHIQYNRPTSDPYTLEIVPNLSM